MHSRLFLSPGQTICVSGNGEGLGFFQQLNFVFNKVKALFFVTIKSNFTIVTSPISVFNFSFIK